MNNLTNGLGFLGELFSGLVKQQTLQRSVTNTKRARQFTAAKGTGGNKNYSSHAPHIGKKQIEKELKRMGKLST